MVGGVVEVSSLNCISMMIYALLKDPKRSAGIPLLIYELLVSSLPLAEVAAIEPSMGSTSIGDGRDYLQ